MSSYTRPSRRVRQPRPGANSHLGMGPLALSGLYGRGSTGRKIANPDQDVGLMATTTTTARPGSPARIK